MNPLEEKVDEQSEVVRLGPGVGRARDRAAPLLGGQPVRMPPFETVGEALMHHGQQRPSMPAVYLLDAEDRLVTLTYGGLLEQARRDAAALRQRGVARGDRVMLSFDTGVTARA